MGVVYLAQNTLTGRPEVLKVVGRHLIERKGVLERFSREIRSAVRLDHPNIVHAYSAFRRGESIVFAMEYVEGLDLARMVKARGSLPVPNACNYVHQAALGLQHAHERGMVHRDIKPGNLMLARKGDRAVIKVLDFGLAKATREDQVDGGLTHEGQMLGTPDYIAPEQIRDAQSADIRADIYSLGCTLYYLLTGGPPFQRSSLYDLLQAHFSMDAEPLNLARPEVPVELAALVAKMMAKEPERRFQEPKEVAQALAPLFKKGNAASTGAKPELSLAGRPEARPATAGVVSVPARPPAQSAMPPEPSVRKPVEAPGPEAIWKSLVDLDETESAKGGAPAAASSRRPPWFWPAVAAGVLFLGFVIAYAVTLKVRTSNGIIELVNLPKDAEVLVDGSKITLTWPGIRKPVEIQIVPGQRRIEVRKDGFSTFAKELTVKAGGSEEITVRLEPLAVDRTGMQEGDARETTTDGDREPTVPPTEKITKTDSGGLSTNEGEAGKPMVGRSPVLPAGDLLQAGTVWKGLSTYVEPAGIFPDFVTELTVTKREGISFEGVYAADRGRHTCDVQGTITDDKIAWNKTKGISGGMVDDTSVDWSGVISHDRIDIRGQHFIKDGRLARFKGFFLRQGDQAKPPAKAPGSEAPKAKRNPPPRPADTLLQTGTVWKGTASYIHPSSYPRDIVIELTIIRRDGNNIEGVYKADKGRFEFEVKGAVADGSIELIATKSRRGVSDFADSPITGVISGDRIDIELKKTFNGEAHYAKGVLIRDAGTGVAP